MTAALTPLAPVQLKSTQRSSIPDSPSTVLTWSRRGSLFETPTVPRQPSNDLQDGPRNIQPLGRYCSGNESPMGLLKRRLSNQLDSPMEPARQSSRGCNITESPLAPKLQNAYSSANRLQRNSTDSTVDTAPPSVHDNTTQTLDDSPPIKPSLMWSSPVTETPSCQRKSITESYPPSALPFHRKRLVSSPEARQRSSTPPIIKQHSVLHRQNSMPTIPSPACLEHTPDPLYLLEGVKRLSISEENDKEVRRQLFPHSTSLTGDSLGMSHSPVLSLHQPETLVGRKANRSRLRRL